MDKGLYYERTYIDTVQQKVELIKLTKQELIKEIISLRDRVEGWKDEVEHERYKQTIKPMMLSGARDAEREATELGNRLYNKEHGL